MKQSRRWHLGLVVSLIIGCLAVDGQSVVQSAEADGQSAGARRALLIGINKYKALPRLQGSINDIETMRQILITRWGVSENRITMVTDEAATRAGILAALETLVKETGPQDIVYVHYSGHGSQVQDLNGDEKDDGLDETIVPQDGRTGEIRDITDDELDEIFTRLRARSALIVLDSCHSGTATRSLDIRTRSVPQDTRVELYRAAAVGTRGLVPLVSSRYILMTGAAAHQEALDGPVDGRFHGFFTYALSRSLASARPGASPREVFGGVERELKRIQTQFGRSSMPEPQLEAPSELLDKPLLTSSREAGPGGAPPQAARLAWLEARALESDRAILVHGSLLEAGPGSMWGIYSPGETGFAPGRALAIATVVELRGNDAVATVQPAGAKIPAGARAVALLPPQAPERVSIRLLNLPQERGQLVEDTLRTHLKDVELVGAGQFARFLVDVKGDTLQVYAADGIQIVASFSLTDPQWGAGFARVMSRSANASDLLALDNPSSQLKVEVRVLTAKAPVTKRGVAVVADTQPARYRIRRSGESRTPDNSLQLEVRASAEVYVAVVDVDSQGGVNLLFPNPHQRPEFYPEGRIRAGEPVVLPDSIQPGNRAGFHWDYTPPSGTDTIRVFASTDLETANRIRQRVQALQASGGQQPSGTIATRSAVAAGVGSLRQDLARVATRGLVKIYDPTPPALTEQTAVPGQPSSEPPAPAGGPPAAEVQSGQGTGETSPAAPPVKDQPAPDWAANSVTVLVGE